MSTRGRCIRSGPAFLLVQLRGPRPSPAERVGRGEEEQGSGRRDAHAWASRLGRTLRRRGRGGPVPGQGRLLQPEEISEKRGAVVSRADGPERGRKTEGLRSRPVLSPRRREAARREQAKRDKRSTRGRCIRSGPAFFARPAPETPTEPSGAGRVPGPPIRPFGPPSPPGGGYRPARPGAPPCVGRGFPDAPRCPVVCGARRPRRAKPRSFPRHSEAGGRRIRHQQRPLIRPCGPPSPL